MPVTTVHQYIDMYPVRHTDTKMIVGTIHPHLHNEFLIPFFYGNVGSFWRILNNAFPRHDLINLENITTMLEDNNVWITDIIRQCDRETEMITQDSLLYNIIYNEDQIRDGLLNSQIDTIYFTSRFSRNNAAKLFTQVFGIDYNVTFNPETSEFVIPENVFGREIRCVVLYSPSNDANRGIVRSHAYLNNQHLYVHHPTPVMQFKIDFYRDKFQFLN